MHDAYKHPQKVRPGCEHRLGCKCVAPFWLREPSPLEQKRIEHYNRQFVAEEVK